MTTTQPAPDAPDANQQSTAAAQPPAPQVVYVYGPPPGTAPTPGRLTPIQQAQLDNGEAWRNCAIVSIILLVTVLMAWAIPIVLLATLIGNNGRISRAQREMAAGITEYTPPEPRNDGPAARWVLAAVALVIGLLVLTAGFAQGSGTTAIPGLLLLGGAAWLAPWSTLRRNA